MRALTLISILLAATTTTFAQSDKDKKRIVGIWQCAQVNDSIEKIEVQRLLTSADADSEDSTEASYFEYTAKTLTRICGEYKLVIGNAGAIKVIGKTDDGTIKVDEASYSIYGSSLVIVYSDTGETGTATILSITRSELVLYLTDTKLIVTYTKQ